MYIAMMNMLLQVFRSIKRHQRLTKRAARSDSLPGAVGGLRLHGATPGGGERGLLAPGPTGGVSIAFSFIYFFRRKSSSCFFDSIYDLSSWMDFWWFDAFWILFKGMMSVLLEMPEIQSFRVWRVDAKMVRFHHRFQHVSGS